MAVESTINRTQVRELAAFYRRHLLDDIMAFWTQRTGDDKHPGHLHQFNREGELTATDKYVWCQGRQTWMFAALCNHLERRDDWLALARTGRDMLVQHAHAGGGRFHYHLERDGTVRDASRSWFTDTFALSGLCEYALASGSDEDMPLIETAFDTWARHYDDPAFAEHHHFQLDPKLRYHAIPMILLGLAPTARALLGAERIDPLAEDALNRVLWRFAKDEHELLFEVLDGEYNVIDTPKGQTINPGHVLESMWFCLEEAMYRQDQRAIDRAVQVTRWAYHNGLDREQGGLYAFTSPTGGPPPGEGPPNNFGENWDTKIWWVHSEALYVLALAALTRGDGELWQAFLDQHDYAQRVFADPEYGEWYCYMERDGSPRRLDKGTWVKSAFHIPRALMKLTLLLERHADGAS